MADTALFVARPSDVATLRAWLDEARGGTSRTVLLQAPLGGGKRAVVGEMIRGMGTDEDTLLVRVALTDEEDGLRTLLRIYAALYGALIRDPVLRGKVELILNAQLPQHPKRVQGWFQAFIEGMKKAVPAEGEQSFQVTLPRDNPLVGLVEIISAISRKMTTVLDLQNVHLSESVAIFQVIEALHDVRKQGRLMIILGTEAPDGNAQAWMAEPYLDVLNRRAAALSKVELAPWGEEEVQAYLASKGLTAAAPGRIAAIAGGRPAYVAEVVDVLAERDRLADALESDTLVSLAPVVPDASELDEVEGEPEEGKRKHAGAADADRVQFLGALLGLAFPSSLIADMGGYERDSVDDLLDACPELVKELQHSKPLDSWIYQYTRGIWRQAVLDAHASDDDHKLAQGVAAWMERLFVPRGYEFVVKTARMFAEHGAPGRAMQLRLSALTADRPDVWAMAQDLVRYYDTIAWPDPMRRVLYTNLLDRMVQGGDVEQAEKLVQEVLAWASEKEDRGLQAWTLFAGSRLDYRRQDHYRARDRAKDALKLYTALDAKGKVAECENHLALVEFSDGNINASLDHLRRALEASNTPPVQANAEFIRGLISRRAKKPLEAAEHFKKANETAGSIGMAPLALEAGFFYGESLLSSKQTSQAADVLVRVAQIARSLQNPTRERETVGLLAEAQGMLRNYESALQWAQRTLQLTQELKFERFAARDIYRVAFFQFQLGRFTEAQSLLAKAAERTAADDVHLLRDVHFHAGLSALRIGERSNASRSLKEALRHGQATKAWRVVMVASEHLADMESERGDKAAAARLLQDALKAAEAADLREERKGLRRKLDEVSN